MDETKPTHEGLNDKQDNSGKPASTTANNRQDFMIDITTRKEAEEALLAGEKRYRTTLDNMMEGCQIIDFSWHYVYINDASARLGYFDKEKLLGRKITDIYPGIEKSKFYQALHKCMVERVPVHMEYEGQVDGGNNVCLDMNIQPVPEGIFVLSLDLTERRKMEDSLRFHASLVENVSDAIISSDVNFNILTWNKAAEEMYGWREAEVIGRTVMEVTKSAPVNSTVEQIKESLLKNSHWRGEALHERKNGQKFNVMVSVSLMKDKNGNETGAVTIFKDITEEKKAEMAIHQSEERFRKIFQSGPLGIIFSTLDNRITMANDRFCELSGYTEEELHSMTFQDFFSTEDTAEVKAKLVQLVQGDVSHFSIEMLCRIKSGQTAWGNLTVTLIRDNGGKPQGFVTMVQDVSARKRSEDKINHLNLVLRSIRNINQLITREKDRDRLIQNVCDILVVGRGFHSVWIILVDENKQPIKWAGTNITRGMEGMIEALRQDNLPECVKKVFSNHEVIITGNPLEQCPGCPVLSKTDGIGSMTVRLECEGTLYGVLCGSMWHSVLKDEDEISLFSEVAADLSFALRDIELSSISDRLAQEQLRASKLESIGTLAGGIAHDFNNLLTGIMGNIGLAKSFAQDNTDAREVLEEAEKAAMRSRDLTQQLLTFARGGKPIKKVTNIAGIIKDAATFAIRGSKVKLKLSLPEDLWMAEVDEGQMGQVIHNLVINADEAMPLGGTLIISAKNTAVKHTGALSPASGNYVQIDVSDTGTGIPPENLPKIFEPYFTTKQEGSGLGLTSAYSIIKSHGGSLLAESRLNHGSVFHIFLPASRKTVKGEKKVTTKQSPRAGGKVLVMDDDEIIRKMLKNMLNLAGYQVEMTTDGAQALKKYKQAMDAKEPFNVVIMDLTIPGGMGGKEAIGKLLKIDPAACVIVSSGYATDPIMSEYKKHGFSAVIAKPYSIQQLQEIITGLTAKKN